LFKAPTANREDALRFELILIQHAMIWNKEKIRSILPQEEPFLFVDEVVSVEGRDRLIAVKNIDGDEEFFKGHFPGRPVMPGVLIVEAMAQASILLYYICKPEIAMTGPDYYLGRVRAEFLKPVYPGDRIYIEVSAVKVTDSAGVVDAVAKVKGQIVSKANLIFGVKRHE